MRWMWIDRVVELVPGHRLVAVKNVSLAEEHLHDHFAASPAQGLPALPVMPMSLIIEGVAQSGGILVGQAEEFRHKIVLAKVSRAEMSRDVLPGATLRYTVTAERMDAAGSTIIGVIAVSDPSRGGGFEEVGRVEMMFSHLDHNMGGAGLSGVDFPAHNFVFGEAFHTLLQTSGVGVRNSGAGS
jgi:3-hydroxyacyl-[acyl-carrier-protein] dehydratase